MCPSGPEVRACGLQDGDEDVCGCLVWGAEMTGEMVAQCSGLVNGDGMLEMRTFCRGILGKKEKPPGKESHRTLMPLIVTILPDVGVGSGS